MPEENSCIICDLGGVEITRVDNSTGFQFNCARCGKYYLTNTLIATRLNNVDCKDRYILSGVIREVTETGGEVVRLTSGNYKELFQSYLIPDLEDVESKVKKLLARLKEKSKYYGDSISLSWQHDYPLAYAQNHKEFLAQIQFLKDTNLLNTTGNTTSGIQAELTAQGWALVNNLKKSLRDSDQAFVAIWFDDQMNESIHTICETITKVGFKPMCIKDEHFSDKIIDKAISEIKKSKFMVADLTGNRTSVFFEVGLAYGLGMDIIYLFKDGEEKTSTLDFYVKHYQCYRYKNQEDLAEQLKNAINARIK